MFHGQRLRLISVLIPFVFVHCTSDSGMDPLDAGGDADLEDVQPLVDADVQTEDASVPAAPPAAPWLSMMDIGGDRSRYNDPDFRREAGLFHWVTLGFFPSLRHTVDFEETVTALRANGTLWVSSYVNTAEISSTTSDSENERDYLESQVGPTGNGGTWVPNDWYLRDEDGNHTSGWSGAWSLNISRHVTPDSQGRRVVEYIADTRFEEIYSLAPSLNAIYSDIFRRCARETADWNRDGSNQDQEDPETCQDLQEGMVRWVSAWRGLKGDVPFIGNVSNWRGQAVPLYDQLINGGFLEGQCGPTWAYEGTGPDGVEINSWGSWELMLEEAAMTLQQMAIHPDVGMPIVQLNAQLHADAYQHARYMLASAVLMDLFFDPTPSSGYGDEVLLFDEMFGSSEHVLANRGWLGQPRTPRSYAPWSGEVRLREFDHGIVLLNPRKLLGQVYPPAATVTPPDAGPGYQWQRLGSEGGMQDPAHNDGTEVTGPITIVPGDAVFLKRVVQP
jgi:hypothetical protein